LLSAGTGFFNYNNRSGPELAEGHTSLQYFMYKVYILLCYNHSFYIGFTNNLKRRLQQHEKAEVNYTSDLLPLKLVYYENYKIKTDALKREKQIKGWSRQKKINLIKFGHPNKFY